ncbi:MAG TPA: His/Gly/Thr/Pro-type tRNA ligase C-terminal domain-containing protein, partial [Clostridia bacterium]|nr:His/Gly/Thr/Pro-type tRNA ligase C-terminal domain-containing protein [Clostridia bacterium]
ISEAQNGYAKKVYDKLIDMGIRAELDDRNEKIGYRIREAQLDKIPYTVVVGDKETESDSVAVRERKVGDRGVMTFNEFASLLKHEIDNKVCKPN